MGNGVTERGELLKLFPGILTGMAVRDQDGRILGKIVRAGDTSFEIKKGFLFPRYYFLNYVDVTESDGKSLYVALSDTALQPAPRPQHTQLQPDNEFQTQLRVVQKAS